MKFRWETEKERISRHMNVLPKDKLEWLQEINEFMAKFSPKVAKEIKRKLKKWPRIH